MLRPWKREPVTAIPVRPPVAKFLVHCGRYGAAAAGSAFAGAAPSRPGQRRDDPIGMKGGDGGLLPPTGIMRRMKGMAADLERHQSSPDAILTVSASSVVLKKKDRMQWISPIRRISFDVKLMSAVCPDVPMTQAK